MVSLIGITQAQKTLLSLIQIELERLPLAINHWRNVAGGGRSQAFGIVNRRSSPPDISRNNWKRPYLSMLLERYGETIAPFDYTSITVNQNYLSKPHKDKGNQGPTYIVAFGNYTGGELNIDGHGDFNISENALIFNGATNTHSTKEFIGNRYSIVFYKASNPPPTCYCMRPIPIVAKHKNSYYTDGYGLFRDGCIRIHNLPHPLLGRTKC